jgi:peptidyl-prolyl cis-trans isomerase SurA
VNFGVNVLIKYLIAGLVLATQVWAAPLDRIIAVVNDEVILESELMDMSQTVRQQLRQREAAIPPAEILRKQVLERLIMQRLQLQRAEEVGVRVGDDALNAALRQIANNNNMNLRQFRETIREEMVITRLRKSQVEDRVVVSDREVDNFLATQTIQSGSEEEYQLQHILISMPDAASPEQVQDAQQRLEKIQSLLAEGGDFAEVAAGYSDGQNALEGGELGWRKQGELPSLFAEAVPALSVGEVSQPLRSGSGFHLVRLKDKKKCRGPLGQTNTGQPYSD